MGNPARREGGDMVEIGLSNGVCSYPALLVSFIIASTSVRAIPSLCNPVWVIAPQPLLKPEKVHLYTSQCMKHD